jgi:isoleucyl-tRNA synthetase
MVDQADKDYDPAQLEDEVRDRWEKVDAYERTREHREGGEPWYFIDGPPYATGHIHLGTAWNKVLKDHKIRFMRMRGYDVRDRPGSDMHGLPIEVQVEEELGIETKGEIEEYGLDGFIERCRDFASGFAETMTEEFRDLGVWMDWDRPYRTVTNDYMEGAWWAVKRAAERALLFRDERGINWCPRCETALAEAELEYWDEEDPSIYVKLPVDGEEDTYLVVWTTTPWTIPANNAVAVHPDLEYAKVWARDRDGDEEHLYVADRCVDQVMEVGGYRDHAVVEHLSGPDLEGLPYAHPLEDRIPYHRDPPSEKAHTVLLGEHVEADHTGLVHTATGHGEEDFELGQEEGVPPFSPVAPDGTYTDEVPPYAGRDVREANEAIVDDLREAGVLLHRSDLEHRYGHCWRCETPILFRTTEQWFVEVTALRDEMLDEVDRVEWTPEWAGSARQRDWVEGVRDWCVSRQRYWGIPLPIWVDEAGHRQVVGSREELADLSDEYEEGQDLHRPWIDDVTLTCPDCGDSMTRVPDVLDVWFDSAVAAWAQLGFPGDREGFDRWFPCDWIVEGLDQTRGWFYSQLAAGVTSHERVPYERVLMHGFVHDAEGQPMSKSKGNVVSPDEVIEEHGRDPFRWFALTAVPPWDDLKFSWEEVQEARRRLDILWNVHVFATTYMSLDGWEPGSDPLEGIGGGLEAEDRWLLSRLQATVETVTDRLEADHPHEAGRALEDLVLEDLSRWYVRLVRDRAWVEADASTKRAAYATLAEALDTVARLVAPFTPHLAEALYRDLGGEHPTVHMADWPDVDDDLRDPTLEERMSLARDVVEAASTARQEAGMKLRWPVGEVVVAGDEAVEAAVEALEHVVADQANAKEVRFAGEEYEGLALEAEPVRDHVGPTFKGEAPAVMDAIREADAEALRADLEADGEAGLAVDGDEVTVTDEMVTFSTALPEGLLGASFEGGAVYVDAERTPALEAESYANELLRRIQETRKEMDLAIDERIQVEVALPDGFPDGVSDHLGDVAREARADDLRVVDEPEGGHVGTWSVEGEDVVVAVTA